MSLTGTGTGCMTTKHKQTSHPCNLRKQVAVICPRVSSEEGTDLHVCLDDEIKLSSDKRRLPLSAEDKSFSASFDLGANEWLAFWLFLVSCSYFLLSKKFNSLCGCRVKPAEKVSLSNRSVPNARTDASVVNDTLSCSESSGFSHRTSSSMNSWTEISTKCDVYSEISDLDKESYWHSVLSLEEEDSEWLSDSITHGYSTEDPSTPLSTKCDVYEISDFDRESYWHSLLSLEEEDSEWLSDSITHGYSTEDPSTPLSTKCDVYSEISDLDRESYWHSLLSLEEEDSEWLSDSITHGYSTEDPSTPLSFKCDTFTDISDVGTPSYWDSLLRLEEEDNGWIPDSKQELEYVQVGSPIPSEKESWGIEVLPSVSSISSSTGSAHCGRSEDNTSEEHLLETADIEELSTDEPLFWPFEGEFNWDSEEPWSSFCTSPRKRPVLDSRSTTSRIKGCEQKGDEALWCANSETSRLSTWSKSSAKTVTSAEPFLNEDFDSNMDLPFEREYFALDQEFPIETLVGLKEFDGHEGLDSEFISDVFMLDESLQ